MTVSVIIATKQEEKHIGRCMDYIKKQSFSQKEIEIIVVDNFSTDKTVEIAKKYTNKVYLKGPERSAQRNYGVSRASGKYIIYLDADMYISRHVVKRCVEKMESDKSIIGLYIKEQVKGYGYFGDIRRFERTFYNGTVIDGLRFLKKSAFNKVFGFDERLYACEDWDLDKRIKKLGSVGSISEPVYHDDGQVTLGAYLLKKIYYSHNFSEYINKWGLKDQDLKRQFGIYYRYLGVFIENGKWKKLITRPDLAAGMFFIKFLVGITYFFRRVKTKIFIEILGFKP